MLIIILAYLDISINMDVDNETKYTYLGGDNVKNIGHFVVEGHFMLRVFFGTL